MSDEGDGNEYRRLMREHGMIVRREAGDDEPILPCRVLTSGPISWACGDCSTVISTRFGRGELKRAGLDHMWSVHDESGWVWPDEGDHE